MLANNIIRPSSAAGAGGGFWPKSWRDPECLAPVCQSRRQGFTQPRAALDGLRAGTLWLAISVRQMPYSIWGCGVRSAEWQTPHPRPSPQGGEGGNRGFDSESGPGIGPAVKEARKVGQFYCFGRITAMAGNGSLLLHPFRT
jgi:hypothetical protein